MSVEIEAKLMVDSPDDETIADVQKGLGLASLINIAESYACLIERIKQKAMLGKEAKKLLLSSHS